MIINKNQTSKSPFHLTAEDRVLGTSERQAGEWEGRSPGVKYQWERKKVEMNASLISSTASRSLRHTACGWTVETQTGNNKNYFKDISIRADLKIFKKRVSATHFHQIPCFLGPLYKIWCPIKCYIHRVFKIAPCNVSFRVSE